MFNQLWVVMSDLKYVNRAIKHLEKSRDSMKTYFDIAKEKYPEEFGVNEVFVPTEWNDHIKELRDFKELNLAK